MADSLLIEIWANYYRDQTAEVTTKCGLVYSNVFSPKVPSMNLNPGLWIIGNICPVEMLRPKQSGHLHPGRLTWNLQITQWTSKPPWLCSMINLQGCISKTTSLKPPPSVAQVLCAVFSGDGAMIRCLATARADVNGRLHGLGPLGAWTWIDLDRFGGFHEWGKWWQS